MIRLFRGGAVPACAAILLAGCVTQQAVGPGVGAGSVDPQSLIGLSPGQVADTLGEPELRRPEPPAEVWQYRTETCVVDLYLYDEDGRLRVTTYQVRPRSNAVVQADRCVADVVAAS